MRAPYGRSVTAFDRTTARPVWPRVPAQWRLRRWLAPRRDVLVAPACGAIALAGLAPPEDTLRVWVFPFTALAGDAGGMRPIAPPAPLLPRKRDA